jgi:uncharacterized heparinase superfamily protein
MRFLARRWTLGAAERAVTMPLVRWTWRGLSDDRFDGALPEFRPSDVESVIDMMQGRYLFAGKLVDTEGISPFAVAAGNEDWRHALHSFAWLRHFRDVRDEGSRRFARTLVLDWIGRRRPFDDRSWGAGLMAQRVMNWLRHYPLLVEEASPEQQAAIARSLGTQVQALRVRAGLIAEPVEALLVAIAVSAAAICLDNEAAVERHVLRLKRLLGREIDADGLHKSRSPRIQLQLLVELVTLRQALGGRHGELASLIAPDIEAMHRAFDRLVLTSGEAAYFNGAGQLPHDIVVAVQAQSQERRHNEVQALVGGYGRLQWGESSVIADGGAVPALDFSGEAGAGALAFEFSHGGDLIVGNCGPAPAELSEGRLLFRRGIAHSGVSIDDESAADIIEKGPLKGRLRARADAGEVRLDVDERQLQLETRGFARRFGAVLERSLTLLSEGKTLVGQDRVLTADGKEPTGTLGIRFHLAPGAEAVRSDSGDVLHITLANGAQWTFLWEGADLRLDDSVRQSASMGFSRTTQIVLEAPAEASREVAWIFTGEAG